MICDTQIQLKVFPSFPIKAKEGKSKTACSPFAVVKQCKIKTALPMDKILKNTKKTWMQPANTRTQDRQQTDTAHKQKKKQTHTQPRKRQD